MLRRSDPLGEGTRRRQVLATVAQAVSRRSSAAVVRVGIDGVDGAGKTHFADELFIAEVDHAVVGFVAVLANVAQEEPDEDRAPYAYVSDLVVRSAYRRHGLGRALLEEAERFARGAGARILRVGVLARNEDARRLYASLGFADYTVQLIKPLR